MVAGQMQATETPLNNVAGFPTEKEMAEKVLPLPEVNKGKYLLDGTNDIGPCMEAGQVIRLTIEHGKNKWFKRSDVFSIMTSGGEDFAGGAHLVEDASLLGRNRIILKTKEETPIALAVQEKLRINKAYFIYGMNTMFEGESPAEVENGVGFYPMYKVRDIDDSHLHFRSLLIWNGHNYQPYLRIVPAARLPQDKVSKLIPPRKGDNLVVDPHDRDICYAVMSKRSNQRVVGWDLCIAPGADVGALLMLAAILDDMVGWFA